MTTRTLGQLATEHKAELLDHHDLELEIPAIAGLQFQGDVAVVPIHTAGSSAGVAVPPAGVAVVRGENGGNTHLLVSDGPVLWQGVEARATRLALGALTVPEGSVAYLTHPEHGFNGIAPGQYEIRRQREQREEIALVQD
jgi:hypothetical protein